MTITIGSFILMGCSIMTGLITEAIKKMVEVNKPNIVAAVVSVVVGIAIPSMYIVMHGLPFDITAILYIISIVVLSWLCAMLGFDKVVQSLNQLKR
jgi:hypothetical protein